MFIKILLSSIALPPNAVGSWTNRIHAFQEKLGYFDHVLSPTSKPSQTFVYCKKKELNVWQKARGNRDKRVCHQFLDQILKIAEAGTPLKILIVDDQTILKAVVGIKSSLPSKSEIYFSYHGHSFFAPNSVFDLVDKVFFLTKAGYQRTLTNNHQFTPECFIVGNGVVGDEFTPLSDDQKIANRKKLGYQPEDLIISWMANSRPVKGLHIFKKVAQKLLEKYPELKIISIGHEPLDEPLGKNWLQVGNIPNAQLPSYLQLSDVYLFTVLWQEGFGLSLAEAVKCGNWAIASNLGGIPTVLEEIPTSILVDNPNMVQNWLLAFEDFLIRRREVAPLSSENLNKIHHYQDWENRFLEALQS